MIIFLDGTIIHNGPFCIHLDVHGVGYQINTPLSVNEHISLEKLENKKLKLHTRIIYREDARKIFGFLSENEAQLFDFLRTLSGIGPQIAMNLISTYEINSLLEILRSKKIDKLQKVPKVGKSKAEKILFESKSKSKKLDSIFEKMSLAASNQSVKPTTNDDEILINALLSLGFQEKEILKAIAKTEVKLSQDKPLNHDNIEIWIRHCLQEI